MKPFIKILPKELTEPSDTSNMHGETYIRVSSIRSVELGPFIASAIMSNGETSPERQGVMINYGLSECKYINFLGHNSSKRAAYFLNQIVSQFEHDNCILEVSNDPT